MTVLLDWYTYRHQIRSVTVKRHELTLHLSITMNRIHKLKQVYPWVQTPLVVGAPMRLISLADLAVSISRAGKFEVMSFLSFSSFFNHESRYQVMESKALRNTPFIFYACPSLRFERKPVVCVYLWSNNYTGGIGFIGGGTDSNLEEHLLQAKKLLAESPLPTRSSTLSIGVGFINWVS